jgi:hypothetical protein
MRLSHDLHLHSHALTIIRHTNHLFSNASSLLSNTSPLRSRHCIIPTQPLLRHAPLAMPPYLAMPHSYILYSRYVNTYLPYFAMTAYLATPQPYTQLRRIPTYTRPYPYFILCHPYHLTSPLNIFDFSSFSNEKLMGEERGKELEYLYYRKSRMP